ncbi:unnamed protein product [Effrenium voratum]|nr:unnamed protein product [Effrenium voratum]
MDSSVTSGTRPGSGGRPGSGSALRSAGALSVKERDSLEILQSAQDSSAHARKVQEEARATEAAAKFEETTKAADAACKFTSSLDEKWEEFKAKFDSLSRKLVESVGAAFGGGASGLRPSAEISVARVAQTLRRAQNLVVLTGAGISAESGIPTFRGADGFWTATWEKYNEMPAELWRWYQYRWGICRKAKPNPGHFALTELEKMAEKNFMLVTQNVDGLHQQAGTDPSKLCEIHGRIDEMRCDEQVEGACLYQVDLNDEANLARARATVMPTPAAAKEEKEEQLPLCPKCGVRQRPKILWFDESYNEAFFKWRTVSNRMKDCDVLLIVGTQLTTGGPRNMVRAAQAAGAIIIRLDTEVDLQDDATAGMLHLKGKSGELLPPILKELAKLRKEPLLAPLKDGSKGSAVRTASTPARKEPERRAPSPGPKAKPKARAPSPGPKASSKPPAGAAPPVPASPPAPKPAPARRAGRAPSDSAVVGFFVYGTLRPDDDSNAAWTKPFNEGMEAQEAFLPGASLYVDGPYPALCLEETSCSVRGALLTPSRSGALMAAKLAEADKIEGYPDLYSRSVATVLGADGSPHTAYVYHRTGRVDRAKSQRIADGDWLSRKRGSD